MEAYLREKAVGDVEVLNFGTLGHNLREDLEDVETFAPEWHPNLIIVQITQNDFTPSLCEVMRDTGDWELWAVEHSYVARMLFAWSFTAKQSYDMPENDRLEMLHQFATQIAKTTQGTGISIWATSVGLPVSCGEHCVAEVFRRELIPYFPLPDDLYGHLTLDVGHFDEIGCDRYGKDLAAWIIGGAENNPLWSK
jgi:hypothetical protein